MTKSISLFLFLIIMSDKVMSIYYDVPAFNIQFESPSEWSKGVERFVNWSYMVVFKVPDNEVEEKEYGRSIYLVATTMTDNLERVFKSEKFKIENSKNSKIIYESEISPLSENAFFVWSYFDNANKTKYLSAERIVVKDGVLLHFKAAWPLLNNCKMYRLDHWLGEMNKLFLTVKINDVAIAKKNALRMKMDLTSRDFEKLLYSSCDG